MDSDTCAFQLLLLQTLCLTTLASGNPCSEPAHLARWAIVDQAPPLPSSSFPIQAILAAAIDNSVVRAHYVRNSPIALIALARRSGRTSLTWVLDFCPPLFAILLTPLEGPLHGCVAACSRVISCWSFTGIKCVEAGCPMSSCLFRCFLLLVRFFCC